MHKERCLKVTCPFCGLIEKANHYEKTGLVGIHLDLGKACRKVIRKAHMEHHLSGDDLQNLIIDVYLELEGRRR